VFAVHANIHTLAHTYTDIYYYYLNVLMANQIAAPGDVVSSLSVPSTDSISFHPLVAMGNHQSEEQLRGFPEYGKLPVHSVPFFFQVNHVHSAFVEVGGVAGFPWRPMLQTLASISLMFS